MSEKQCFQEFITLVLAEPFEGFYDIEYPAPPRGRRIEDWRARATKSARNWVGTVMLKTGTSEWRHVMVTEEHPDHSFSFHILFGGCDWDKFHAGHYPYRWWLRFNEKAFKRKLDQRKVGGLLWYFVVRQGFPIRVVASELNGTYTREDFV